MSRVYEEFRVWLRSRYRARTVESYERSVLAYGSVVGQGELESAGYGELVSYVSYLRSRYGNKQSFYSELAGVRAWHRYLVERGIREDNPCTSLRLVERSTVEVRTRGLLSSSELGLLLQSSGQNRRRELGLRDKVVMGLLVHQALRVREMLGLRVEDIDLQLGCLSVESAHGSSCRQLRLSGSQILVLQQYIGERRGELLVGHRGGVCGYDSIEETVKRYKHVLKGKSVSAVKIRQSVIALKLRQGHDVRYVQYFAGHSKPSITAQYQAENLSELRMGIRRYHPLQ